jgi:hypothetical protein
MTPGSRRWMKKKGAATGCRGRSLPASAQKNSINPAAGENEVFFLGFVTVSLLHE